MHREELVVRLVGHELEPGQGQLGADDQRQEAAEEEEDERVDEVQDPDLLVIGRRQPLVQAGPVARAAGVSAVVAIGAPYSTFSVPVMFGWTEQMKPYAPAGSGGTS